MKLVEAVAKRTENLLAEKEMTMYQLAKNGGINRSTVWHVVNVDLARVSTVKLDTVYQIAATLDMTLQEFFDDPLFDDISD
ncbi:MAG: helix-turn-helix domain-containing protein [Candidatus Fimimonas sp.]